MRILHCADLHLRDRDIEEAEKCLNFLVETAQQKAINLTVIAGDIFDSQEVKLDSRAARLAVQTVSALADIAPVAIVLGTSSHDGKAPEILRYARGKHDIHVAGKPEQIRLHDGIITLIPQPTKQFFQTTSGISDGNAEIGAAMSAIFAGFGAQAKGLTPHILIYHGSISGSRLSNGQALIGMDIEVSADQLALSNACLILCGHIHLPQELPGNIFYSGSLYPNNWGEDHEHGFFVHDILVGETRSEFIKTPTKKLARFSHDFTNGSEPEQINDDAVAGAHVRIDYKVWQDEAGTINKEEITERLTQAGAQTVDIRIIRVPRQNVRSEAVLLSERLRDKIQKMADLKGENIEWTVLLKAELLEKKSPEEIIEAVGRAI